MKCCDICGEQGRIETITVEKRSSSQKFGNTLNVIDACRSCEEKVFDSVRKAVEKLKKVRPVVS